MRVRWVLGLVSGLAVLIGSEAARAAEPTDQEQFFIYELNRARHDPPAWAAEFGLGPVIGGDGLPVDLVGVEARPPLAVNEDLVTSARFHSDEMAANRYFGHQSDVTGDWPNEMARDAGYMLPGFFPDTANYIESIACGFGPGSSDLTQPINALILLIVDENVPSLGHRVHLLAMNGFNADFREIGVGYGSDPSFCTNYWSIHTGREDTIFTFLTGVVFDDLNQNALYDAGEGLGGVTVSADGLMTLTNAAGGWSIQAGDGPYDVSCSGSGFVGTATASVSVAGSNREVDCISGSEAALVNFVVPEADPRLGRAAALLGLAFAVRRRRGFRSASLRC